MLAVLDRQGRPIVIGDHGEMLVCRHRMDDISRAGRQPLGSAKGFGMNVTTLRMLPAEHRFERLGARGQMAEVMLE